MIERIEYIALKSLLGIAKVMPIPLVYALFDSLARGLYRFDAKRRRITLENLAHAFPKLDETKREKLARAVYRQFGQSAAEILLMFVDRFDIDEAVMNKAEALKRIEWVQLRAQGRGVIALTAHFGNWELLAHFLAMHGFTMLVIGREGNNKLIERRITTPFRRKYGNDSAYKDNAMLAMVKRLKKGGNVGILIDQKAGANASVKVPFFGEDADTTLSVATLKQKLDPLIVPFYAVRTGKGQYRIEVGDPIEYTGDEKGEEALAEMTAQYNREMEKMIKRHPEQWFWMHNRWRR
jgi:KDO2-lipid IV(A) lauroyltransferase